MWGAAHAVTGLFAEGLGFLSPAMKKPLEVKALDACCIVIINHLRATLQFNDIRFWPLIQGMFYLVGAVGKVTLKPNLHVCKTILGL